MSPMMGRVGRSPGCRNTTDPAPFGVSTLEDEAVLKEKGVCALQESRPRHQTGASIFCEDSCVPQDCIGFDTGGGLIARSS